MLPFVHITCRPTTATYSASMIQQYHGTPFEDVPVDSLAGKEELIEANTSVAHVRCRSHEECTGNYSSNFCAIASRLSKSAGNREDLYPMSYT